MPGMVVVSVPQEEESVLPPLFPRCFPLPCAALQVVSENSAGWKALLCFIFARLTFTCDHYLMGFPVAFCGSVSCKRAWKVFPRSLPPAVLDGCRTWRWSRVWQRGSLAGQHLRALPKLHHGGLPVCWCGSGPDLVASSCSFLGPSVPSRLSSGLLSEWWLHGDTHAKADSLLPYLLWCRRNWGGTQPNLLLCLLLVR